MENKNYNKKISQILKTKYDCNEAVHQLFIDLKKTYDSVRRAVLYNNFLQLSIT